MESHIFINRRNLSKLIWLAVVCLGFAIGGCDFQEVDASAETNTKEEKNMESLQSTQSTTTVQHKIPPIDASVLPETETATFALG